MSIIKRKKQDKFFLMSNHATQKNLTSLQSIGLLAYIISLPEDWILHKTQLQNKFTRRTVDSAWNELVDKNYIAGFICYVGKEKRYYYLASDEELNQNEYDQFIQSTLEEIKEETENIYNIKAIPNCKFSTVRFEQYKKDSSKCTVQNAQIQMKQDNKEIPQINNNKDISNVNINLLHQSIIYDLFLKHGCGLFNKTDIKYFSERILEEAIEEIIDPESYFTSIVETIINRRKKKLGILPPVEVPIYNWLEH